jgi:hypothetical protein
MKKLIAAIKQYFVRSQMTPEERYYSEAVDVIDLEWRMRNYNRIEREQNQRYRFGYVNPRYL